MAVKKIRRLVPLAKETAPQARMNNSPKRVGSRTQDQPQAQSKQYFKTTVRGSLILVTPISDDSDGDRDGGSVNPYRDGSRCYVAPDFCLLRIQSSDNGALGSCPLVVEVKRAVQNITPGATLRCAASQLLYQAKAAFDTVPNQHHVYVLFIVGSKYKVLPFKRQQVLSTTFPEDAAEFQPTGDRLWDTLIKKIHDISFDAKSPFRDIIDENERVDPRLKGAITRIINGHLSENMVQKSKSKAGKSDDTQAGDSDIENEDGDDSELEEAETSNLKSTTQA
ncbi:hypothetical protein BJ138DRAFT_1110463 [Hygrophoropsis aurantiaca]|uniref:Uncharacterized protein n=1 Tax=Hygrophoropsis aurantiaca TaxID=72124 RepID=A0ACB8AMY4_9AGAM|nr:hypothetical protein BJ138DRAFT_1110463 [Hygrophoropsis aurantiaca]